MEINAALLFRLPKSVCSSLKWVSLKMASISKRSYVTTFITVLVEKNNNPLFTRKFSTFAETLPLFPVWQFWILRIVKSLHILSCYFDVYNLIKQADKSSILHPIHNISKCIFASKSLCIPTVVLRAFENFQA